MTSVSIFSARTTLMSWIWHGDMSLIGVVCVFDAWASG